MYDIRGIYPDEINERVIKSIGRALVGFLRKKYKKKKVKIVISRDNRISSFPLYQALKKEILKQEIEVIDIGLGTTPMFYFAVQRFNCDGGVQITASHLPPQYNGCKLVGREAILIGGDSGLEEVRERVCEIERERGENPPLLKLRWAKKENILAGYLESNFKNINIQGFKDLRIAIDTGNAVSGILIKEFKKHFPGKIYHLFPKLDGNFPNHLLNPIEEKNIKDLKKIVKEKKLDLGIAFDGDGDRIIFIDEKGETISPDFITCLLSEILLRKVKKEKIIYTICSSNIIKEVVEKNYGIAIPWKVGHGFIKQKMKKEKAIFGAEYSGHYFLKSHHFSEVPLYILLKVLEEVIKSKKSISKLVSSYKKYFYSGVINLKVKDKKKKLEEIEKKYRKEKISHLDGLRIDFSDYWFIVRPSNTEDLLRIVVEAKSEPLLREKIKALKKIIKNPA